MTRPRNENNPPHLHGLEPDPAAALPEAVRRGPVVILVETQMGENIGAAARAMANFGLRELRLVNPRDGWPNDKARAAASRGDGIIDAVTLFPSLEAAIADLNYVYATTARRQDIAKPVASPAMAAAESFDVLSRGERVGIVFGRERWGLKTEEVGLADAILTVPVDPTFASLNVGQAVILCAYEWRQRLLAQATGEAEGVRSNWTPFFEKERSPQATKDEVLRMFAHLEAALDAVEFFRPVSKRNHMILNLRQIFQKARLSEQEIRTLRGAIAALERRPTRRDAAMAAAAQTGAAANDGENGAD